MRCGPFVVLGAATSPTPRAPALRAEGDGRRVFRINHVDELPDDLAGVVGVTAGASAPEELVSAVIARLAPRRGVEPVRVTEEDEYFPPPRNIRDLQASVGAAACTLLAGPTSQVGGYEDRELAASDVLDALLS